MRHHSILTFLTSKLNLLASSGIALRKSGLIWLVCSKLIQGLSSLIASLVIARQLGPEAFGQLTLAITTASVAATASSLGLEQIASKEYAVAISHNNSYTTHCVIRKLRTYGAIVAATAILLLSYSGFSKSANIGILLVILSLLPIVQIGDIWEWRHIAEGRSRLVAVTGMTTAPVAAAIRICLSLNGYSVQSLAWVLIAEFMARSILFVALQPAQISSKTTDRRIQPPVSSKSLLNQGIPLALAGLAVFAYMRLDQFMIAGMLGQNELGLYSAIVTISEAPLVIPALVLKAYLPILSKTAPTNELEFDVMMMRMMRLVFYSLLFVSIVVCYYSNEIVSFLYGSTYTNSSTALGIAILSAPFIAIGITSSAWIVIKGCTKHALKRTSIGLITNFVLNLFMIPRYGIAGAAAATLTAQIMATYISDVIHHDTRALFVLKTRAIFNFG